MVLRLFSLIFLFFGALPLALSEYADSNFTLKAQAKFQAQEEYKAIVTSIITDLHNLKPRFLINFCSTINFDDNSLELLAFYYNKQYERLISGLDFIDSEDSSFFYMKEAIVTNLQKERADCLGAITCESKKESIYKFYDGLLGSAMIVERILNGVTFKQLYKEAISLA